MMSIQFLKFLSQEEQYLYLTKTIKSLLEKGHNPGEIAIISRRHNSLARLLPYLHHYQIDYNYEKGQNVLENSEIQQLLQILEYSVSLINLEESKDYLLPQILAFPFWEIPSLEIINLTVAWQKNNLDKNLSFREFFHHAVFSSNLVSNPDNQQKIQHVFILITELSKKLITEPAEEILNLLLGNQEIEYFLEDYIDLDNQIKNPENLQISTKTKLKLKSPFKYFYFEQPFKENQNQVSTGYMRLLSNLQVIFELLREYSGKTFLKVEDLLKILKLYEKNKLTLINNLPYGKNVQSINLLTAHKSKGLEFETVFIIDCTDSEWSKTQSTKLGLPFNLKILPAKDDLDDKIRLFYVAITRAKTNLYFSTTLLNEKTKETNPLRFVDKKFAEISETKSSPEDLEIILKLQKLTLNSLNILAHRELLEPLIENYKLSVTHLINFLNVADGGPQKFLTQNLLRFPQRKNPSGSYGTAMHSALQFFQHKFKETGQLPKLEVLQNYFQIYLKRQKLTPNELQKYTEKGLNSLEGYYNTHKNRFKIESRLEYNFNREQVAIGQVEGLNGLESIVLSGKIDKMDFQEENKEIIVTDFKTSQSYDNWKGKNPNDKLRLWKYDLQLQFYKLLIENSNSFSRYTVNKGCLEFLDPHSYSQKYYILTKDIQNSEIEKLKELIKIVYKKIINLDFPDTSEYQADYQGVQNFIENLLEDKI